MSQIEAPLFRVKDIPLVPEKVRDSIELGELTRLILILGPVRSSTTALLRLFAHAGVPGIYQPVKAQMRLDREGSSLTQTNFAQVGEGLAGKAGMHFSGIVAVKETVGGIYTNEAADYYGMYAEKTRGAGVPLDVLLVSRNPYEAFESCRRIYGKTLGDENLLDMFLLEQRSFYQQAERVLGEMDKTDIAVWPRDFRGEESKIEEKAREMIDKFGIVVAGNRSITSGWEPTRWGEAKGIYIPEEPEYMDALNNAAHEATFSSISLRPPEEKNCTLNATHDFSDLSEQFVRLNAG